MTNKKFISIKNISNNPYFRFFMLWLLSYLILLGYTFTSFLNILNYLEIFPSEFGSLLFMHAITALIIALVIYFIKKPKNLDSKLLAVTIISLLMVSYNDRLNSIAGFYRSIIPVLTTADADLPFISLAFLVTIFVVAILIGNLFEKYQTKHKILEKNNIAYLLFIIVGVVFLNQAVRIAYMSPSIISQSKVQAPLFQKTDQTAKDISKPDIYFIILDRYNNNQVLAEQYSFDNSNFTNNLKDNGFKVNELANSNYPVTTISIASTLNADYSKNLTDQYVDNPIQSRTLYHNLIYQSSVIKALKADGYKYHHIGSNYGASYRAPMADADYLHSSEIIIFGKIKKVLRGVEIAQFNQSPYYQFFKVKYAGWPLKYNELDNITYIRKQLNALNEIADSKNGGRFIWAHILVPHDPFSFNADGSSSIYQYTDSTGKPIKDKYIDQVKFINTQIEQLVAKIQKNSKRQAVIVINSDEGAYPQDMNKTNMKPIDSFGMLETQDMTKWSMDWLKMKFSILQAAYIPNASEKDLATLSSVNVFRIILNNYLGYNLEYLPNCNFAFTEGDKYMYRYADITPKLQGTDNNQNCKSQATVSN